MGNTTENSLIFEKNFNIDNNMDKQAAAELLAQSYAMIVALSREYHTIWLVDKETRQMSLIHSSGVSTIQNAVKIGKDLRDFDAAFAKYIDSYVEPEDRKRMHREINFDNVMSHLEKSGSYTVNYLRRDEEGHVGYHQLMFSDADVKDGKKQFVYGFRDIDSIIKEEQAQENKLQRSKNLAEKRNKELQKQIDIVSSLIKVYNAIYYVDMRDYSFIELGVNFDFVEDIIGTKGDGRKSFEMMYKYLVVPEDVEKIKKFTDLTTLNERLKEREWISCRFLGSKTGWSEGFFIAASRGKDGLCDHVIWCTRNIDEEIDKEQKLISRSNTDELTGLYNRRAYEDAVSELEKSDRSFLKNFVYISADLNGVKVINDNLGHAAGDELIIAAGECLSNALGKYGKVYRTGGDEFIALIYANVQELDSVREKIDETSAEWTGKLVESMSLSVGAVRFDEMPDATIHEISILADKRMYESKSRYYQLKGVDRRGQRDAHKVLCALYTKILKINITDDTYQIINIDASEQNEEMGYADSISMWLKKFALTGQVHPDDREEYLKKTDLNYMREFFKDKKKLLHMTYRRKSVDGYNLAIMEIIPANDYSDDSQNLFLYVKAIDA